MIDVNALLKEVDDEVAKESREKAKRQLKEIQKDINNAEQILANLQRKKADLLVSITEGTN